MFSGVLSIHMDMSDAYYSGTLWTTYNNNQFLFMLCLQSSRRWSRMVNGLQNLQGWVTRNLDAQGTYDGIIGLHQELQCIRGVWRENFLCECTRWGRLRDHPHEQHLPALHLWAGSIPFASRARCSSVAGKIDRQCWKRSGHSRGIETGQATHLGDPEVASVSLVMMPPRHHLPALPFEIGGLQLNWYYFCQRELAHLLYLGITPFCTQSRGLVLNLKNSPTE